ncbi:MAG: TonB-dependent receptor [Chitinophagaceae bacterium]
MKKRLSLWIFVMSFATMVFAQGREITGKVTDETGKPLEAVTIFLKGSATRTLSSSDGTYRLNVPAGVVELEFSHAGYKNISRRIEGNTFNLQMETNVSSLDDVVVIGYQTVKRKDLTGSVSSIGARDLKDIPLNSTSEALAGRLAGVQILQSEGSPEASATIRVRGGGSITQDNSPLYVVDGIQVENALTVLSPQDIQSIDVLKDASATAIYGARGANGVVIITTKGGKAQPTRVNYSGLVGVRQLANKLDVMKPVDFVRYQYERSRGSSADELGFLQNYGRFEDIDIYNEMPFVDWQEAMFGRDAIMQTHNVSLVGGSASTKFNLSVTSNKEDGIMLGSDFDRKLINFRLDHNVNEKLKVGVTVRYNNTTVNGAGTSNEGSSANNRLRHAIKYKPVLGGNADVFDYDPDYALETNANSLALVNPILLNQAEYRKNLTTTANYSGYFDYQFNRYLSFKSTIGYDQVNIRQNAFNDTITSIARANANMPTASIRTISRTTINNSNVLSFTTNRSGSAFSSKNSLDVLAGHEIYDNVDKDFTVESRYFPVGTTPKIALGNMGLGSPPAGSTQPPPITRELTNRIVSFFGRVNYAYQDKYLASVSFRGDGSTKFAPGKKWGYFPSASLAWRVSREDFFKNASVISDLKFRLSYGEAGNNRIDNFLYLSQFTPTIYYSINDQLIPAYSSASLANYNLRWETTVSRNIGLDAAFFNNRLSLTADLYHNTTRDLLVNVLIPTNSGYLQQIQNVGSTTNRGVELQISGTPVAGRDFRWNTSFNISFNKNEVKNLGDNLQFALYSSGWGGQNQPSDYLVRPGSPVGTIWGLKTDGFYRLEDFDYDGTIYTLKAGVPNNVSITSVAPQPGGLKFEDISGPAGRPDGLVDNFDRTVIGNTQPKFFGGINQQFVYKNFDLSTFLNFQVGNDVYNANKLEFSSGYTPNSNLLEIMNDRWTNINAQGEVVTDPAGLAALNSNAKLWSPLESASSFYVHSWAVEDGSFLRINNITLGYTIPTAILKKIRVQSFRVYGTVNNLAVITGYSGYDPEVNTRRNTPMTPGVDYSAYPRSRSFIVGLNLSL